MATDVAVVIAYRDMGDEHRARSFRFVLDWWRQLDVEIVVESGTSDETFTRASAINAAVSRATGNVIVQCDPDSLVPLPQLHAALACARMGAGQVGLVIPHNWYLYLNREATEEVYAGANRWDRFGPFDCESHGPAGKGNVVVFPRATWEAVGGFDERFGLWGGDDAAFGYATEAMVGPTVRISGPMIHLWHPRLPQSIPGNPGYSDQFAILAQYRDAAAIGPDAVRALIEARRLL